MALIYDQEGNIIGDDGAIDTTPPVSVASSDVGYFQKKVIEFQSVLNSIDDAAQSLESMLVMDITEDQVNQVQAQLSEYYARRSAFKFAAESFNALSGAVNAVGGSLSQINIPSGLGFAPLVVPAAWIAAIAGASLLITFALGWVANSHNLALEIANSITDPVKRDAALQQAAKVAAANQAANTGPIGSLASGVKWIAIAGLAYMAFKMLTENNTKRGR